MNYSWQILKIGTRDETNNQGQLLENSVVYVHWKKIATDESGNVATFLGESKFTSVDVAADSFIAIDNVTKAEVVSWIEESLSETEKKTIDTVLARKLEKNSMKTFIPNWE